MSKKERIINSFKGEFRFLSNFYINEIIIRGNAYKTVEHYYQSMKTKDNNEKTRIIECATPGQAKKIGNIIKIRNDWEEIKVKTMKIALKKKFQNKFLQDKLIDTYPLKLIEGNYWHDNFWGDCYCKKCINIKGQNMLGKLLMSIRKKYCEAK